MRTWHFVQWTGISYDIRANLLIGALFRRPSPWFRVRMVRPVLRLEFLYDLANSLELDAA